MVLKDVIQEELLTVITKRTTLLTSSIGGGSGGDAQNLAERGQNGADCRINVSVTELARDD